jgi:hypothetical protein
MTWSLSSGVVAPAGGEPLLFDIAAEPLPKTVDRVVCRGWESGTVADESGAAALPRTMGTSP